MLHQDKFLDDNLWEMHLSRQFGWTVDLRKMLYDKVDMKNNKKVLDVGCGIGLIAREVHKLFGCEVYGIDLNKKLIEKATEKFPEGHLLVGDGAKLPYKDDTFDCTMCHFLLMWVKKPGDVVSEMIRVTKPGGWILCSSEPDYGGKIDYPDDYNAVPATIRAVQHEGADPYFGRKLKATMSAEGLKPEMGVWANLWDDETMRREFEHIWKFSELTAKGPIMKNWVQMIKKRDQEALDKGERVTLLPLFWGIAKK